MARAVRIERCPDQLTADARRVALTAEHYQVQVITGPAIVVSSDAVVANNRTTLNDRQLWDVAPFVVIGVLP